MIVKIHCKRDDILNGIVSKAGSKNLEHRAKAKTNYKKMLTYKGHTPSHKIVFLKQG